MIRRVLLADASQEYIFPEGTSREYSPGAYSVNIPPGRYYLQCWGSKGSNGGKGGYSEGVLRTTSNTTLYVYVGGYGTNGGGVSNALVDRYIIDSGSDTNPRIIKSISIFARHGGGATDICLVQSSISNRSQSSLLSRFIVAGGGSGNAEVFIKTTTTTTTRQNITASATNQVEVTSGRYYTYNRYPVEEGCTYDVTASTSNGNRFILRQRSGTGTIYENTYYGTSLSRSVTAATNAVYLDVAVAKSDNSAGAVLTSTLVKISTSTEETENSYVGDGNVGGGTSGGGPSGYVGTQNSAGNGGSFGYGSNTMIDSTNLLASAGGGGGGWYGGGSYQCSGYDNPSGLGNSGGGSGFVNISANASYRPSGYSGLVLDSGTTLNGTSSFPSISGGTETGHNNTGYAKITRLSDQNPYVDLGLPSGLLWAECNLGASSPEECGLYYSWGNTVGYENTTSYDFSQSSYNSTSGSSVSENITMLSGHDAAQEALGGYWRLPTASEFQELYDNTDKETVSNYNNSGLGGTKFMKKTDHSVFIFMPKSGNMNGTEFKNYNNIGWYWSSTRQNGTYAYEMYVKDANNIQPQRSSERRLGFTIRPVRSQ